jgi:hypothetical protein
MIKLLLLMMGSLFRSNWLYSDSADLGWRRSLILILPDRWTISVEAATASAESTSRSSDPDRQAAV